MLTNGPVSSSSPRYSSVSTAAGAASSSGREIVNAFLPLVPSGRLILARLTPIHRRFAIAQNVFIGGVMIFAGIVSLVCPSELTSGTSSARIVCAGIALWWGARWVVLPWLRVGPELRTRRLRIGFVLLHVECAAFAVLYGWLALRAT
jgi:hypothetical protein